MGVSPNPAIPTAARPGRSGPDEDVARLKARLLLQHVLVASLATVGLDTRRARDRLRQTADDLACLRYRRQPAAHA
jgi:hypothetical protein